MQENTIGNRHLDEGNSTGVRTDSDLRANNRPFGAEKG